MAAQQRDKDFSRPELSTPWQRLSRHPAFAPVVVALLLGGTGALVFLAIQRFM